MKTEDSAVSPGFTVWEDLVHDFLEMACFLSDRERDFLVDALRRHTAHAEAIHAYPCFAINGTVIVVCEEGNEHGTCWLYYPKAGKIVRYQVKKD